MSIYELKPVDGRKRVYLHNDGARVLESYGTNVLRIDPDGTLHRLWGGWSATTGCHIAAFAGINKKEWEALPCSDI